MVYKDFVAVMLLFWFNYNRTLRRIYKEVLLRENMASKYIELDLNDPRAGLVAEVIANDSCKKIIGLLAEREMSESDISKELNIPMNTAGYNVKKLVDAGLIEKTKGFFWSVKGRKINTYKVVNKKIVISPKSVFRGVVPAVIASVLGAIGIKLYFDNAAAANYASSSASDGAQMMVRSGGEAAIAVAGATPGIADSASGIVESASYLSSEVWAWFLFGALAALLIFVLWNWRKK